MQKRTLVLPTFALLIVAGCSTPDVKEATHDEAAPINCATAQGDIRALNGEKANLADEVAAGVTSIIPVSAVAHMFEGKEGETLKIGSGEYDAALGKKIAEIKESCGLD